MSTASTSPATLTRLTENTEYEIRVRATDGAESGDWSSTITQTTPSSGPGGSQDDALTQVTNVAVNQGAQNTELMVSWDTQMDATNYDIEYRTGSEAWSMTTSTTGSVTLTNLQTSATYEVRVRATTQTEMGDWSSTITQTTAGQSPPPLPDPILLQVSNVNVTTTMTNTELMVTFDTQQDATGYDIDYRTGSNSWTTITASTSPATLTRLTENTEYEIRVRATTQTQNGDWSSTITQSTPQGQVTPPPATLTQVSNVAVSTTTEETELSISFDTQTQATGYDIEYRLTSTAPSGLWTMSATSSSPTTITGLMSSSSYQVRVRATTQTETGDWSSIQTQTTPDAPQGPGGQQDSLTQVMNVLVSTTTEDTELMVSWDIQADATSYDIEHRTGSGNWTMSTATTSPANVNGINRGHRV